MPFKFAWLLGKYYQSINFWGNFKKDFRQNISLFH